MKQAITTGLGFGLTSGVITTLGLIVGLHSGTHSRAVIAGGIVTIAVADALSDALGIHISEESRTRNHDVWQATIMTFIAKLVMALTFLVPVLSMPLDRAIVASVFWGFLVLTAISWQLAIRRRTAVWNVVGEHLLIAGVVVATTHWIGDWVAVTFGPG